MRLARKVLATGVLLVLAVTSGAASQAITKRKKHTKKTQHVELPPLPPGPLQPLPLDTVPAVAPEVSYENGSLTILAKNSSLSDILRAVEQHTGATIDVPSAPNERVVTSLGPGPARDVLAKLLNGSRYNYVMLGSPTDPLAVSKIILTSKSTGPDASGGGGTSTAAMDYQRAMQGVQHQPQVMPSPPPQETAEGEAEEPEPEPDAEETVDPSEQADAPAEGNTAQPAQAPAAGPNGPKTPEQLLQELQRQQQLLLQQQQQGQQQPQQPASQPPPADQPPQQ